MSDNQNHASDHPDLKLKKERPIFLWIACAIGIVVLLAVFLPMILGI